MFFYEIEMGEYANDFWKPVSLEDVKEFKRLLHKEKSSIHN